jgi:hypothetical protein
MDMDMIEPGFTECSAKVRSPPVGPAIEMLQWHTRLAQSLAPCCALQQAMGLLRRLQVPTSARLRSFFVPPLSGNYSFFFASDDQGVLNATYFDVRALVRSARQGLQCVGVLGCPHRMCGLQHWS